MTRQLQWTKLSKNFIIFLHSTILLYSFCVKIKFWNCKNVRFYLSKIFADTKTTSFLFCRTQKSYQKNLSRPRNHTIFSSSDKKSYHFYFVGQKVNPIFLHRPKNHTTFSFIGQKINPLFFRRKIFHTKCMEKIFF